MVTLHISGTVSAATVAVPITSTNFVSSYQLPAAIRPGLTTHMPVSLLIEGVILPSVCSVSFLGVITFYSNDGAVFAGGGGNTGLLGDTVITYRLDTDFSPI